MALGERHYLLVVPDFSVSTRQVFSDPALKRDSGLLGIEEATAGGGRNDCEPVVMGIRPHYAEIMRELRRWGQPKLTGTGSGIFVQMPDAGSAINAATELKCRYNVRAVRGVDSSPLHQMLDSDLPGSKHDKSEHGSRYSLELAMADCEIQIAVLRVYSQGIYGDVNKNDWFDQYEYLSAKYHAKLVFLQNFARKITTSGLSLH